MLYYSQAGGTPAITDSLLLTVDTTWNGAELTSASSVSLDSRALTTLNSVKRALGITGSADDTVLTELINQMSDKIERVAGRRFAAADYTEWISAGCERYGQVRNWPIIRVESVRYSLDYAINVDYTGSDVNATVSVYFDEEGRNGKVRLTSISAAGTETTTDVDFATYPTLSTVVTQISAQSGWTATKVPSSDDRADTLYPVSGFDAKGQTAQLRYMGDLDLEYGVDHRLGRVYFGGMAARLVRYRGGYETVPDDVAALCNTLVARAYRTINVNTALASESIPDYSYSVASGVQLTLDERAMLNSYSVIGVG